LHAAMGKRPRRVMDLRSDQLYWPGTCNRPAFEYAGHRPAEELRCEALVVGSGITGALLADHFTAAGIQTIVADRRSLACGSTPATTALLQYEIDVPLLKLVKLIGRTNAQLAYLATNEALSDMVALIAGLRNDCDLTRRQSLYLAVKPEDAEELEAEAAARREIGLPAAFVSQDVLQRRFGIERPGAILSEVGLEVNPLKLTFSLLTAAAALGARIFEQMEVDLSCVHGDSSPMRLTTSSGVSITADWVVIATGYETPEQFGVIRSLTKLKSTYAAATAPLNSEPWPECPLVWEAADPYFYARTTRDWRIILGGEDESFTDADLRDSLIPAKANVLRTKLRALFPRTDPPPSIEFQWAGTFAETADGLPYIGRHPLWSNVLFALGYGGNGITFSLIAAQILRDIILRKNNPSAALFSFAREPSTASTRRGG